MLKNTDAEIFEYISLEEKRHKEGIELIASENYVSKSVLEAMGSVLTNKYSEGYPGKRYYGGNEYIDMVEKLAIQRAKKLFNAEHVNVQPYSGSPANLAVHFAFLNPGDKTMGMDLYHGGHLTHGFKVSISGKYFDSVSYGTNSEGYIDYDEVRNIARKHMPKLIWCGASAYSRIIDFQKFRDIADEVNAILVADIAHIAGLVATGLHPSPVGIADVVTTTTHKTLRGPRGGMIMCKEKYADLIDSAVFPGLQGGPHNHITAGIAVALREASTESFRQYMEQVIKNSKTFVEEFSKRGYDVVSGGTDNHLLLLDVTKIDGDLTGKIASEILEKVNVSVNKNAIPFDPRKLWDPSGIRIGTPAITSRGIKQKEIIQITEFIDSALKNRHSENRLNNIKDEIIEFTKDFDIYPVC
jgi:glycine hydroxymethyltransferase